MPITVDRRLVEYLARLSRLALTEEEVPVYERQLTDILGLMEKLSTIDVSGVPDTVHVLGQTNVFRPDEPAPSLSRDDVLANAPETRDGCFAVPRVIG
jgi:aspartyl-tRNA(Asn)/glutamyl-tRNA(Gln) amidotransferase subunit C